MAGQKTHSAPRPLRVMGFGESMIRLAPHPTYMKEGEAMYGRGYPSGNAPYLRRLSEPHILVGIRGCFLTQPCFKYLASAATN